MSEIGGAYHIRRSVIGSDPMTRRFPAWLAADLGRSVTGQPFDIE